MSEMIDLRDGYPPRRYLVTVRPRVSIMPERYVRVVEVDGPRPEQAIIDMLALLKLEDVSLWQSDDLSIQCERVA